ncbi:MAG: hypothetical protein IAE78_29550 [Myxococcus sp.]|nr:hypothetical protein [Myxococcus sp.]
MKMSAGRVAMRHVDVEIPFSIDKRVDPSVQARGPIRIIVRIEILGKLLVIVVRPAPQMLAIHDGKRRRALPGQK